MKRLLLLIALLLPLESIMAGNCVGRFVNPITDICWKCIFPIRIAGLKVASGEPDPEGAKGPLCTCGTPIPRVRLPRSPYL